MSETSEELRRERLDELKCRMPTVWQCALDDPLLAHCVEMWLAADRRFHFDEWADMIVVSLAESIKKLRESKEPTP